MESGQQSFSNLDRSEFTDLFDEDFIGFAQRGVTDLADSSAGIVNSDKESSDFFKANTWKITESPLFWVAIQCSFGRPYPFSLDPARKFLRTLYNMSKLNIIETSHVRKIRTEHALTVLYAGLMKKKKTTLRAEPTRLVLGDKMIWNNGPDDTTVKKEDWRADLVVTDPQICDFDLSMQVNLEGQWRDQYLITVIPPEHCTDPAIEALVLSDDRPEAIDPKDHRSIPYMKAQNELTMENEKKIMNEMRDPDWALAPYFQEEYIRHQTYRKRHNFAPRQPVVSIMMYLTHIGANRDQTIHWWFVVSDETSWTTSTVISGIVHLQQLYLSVLCGGNSYLDLMSMARRERSVRQWLRLKSELFGSIVANDTKMFGTVQDREEPINDRSQSCDPSMSSAQSKRFSNVSSPDTTHGPSLPLIFSEPGYAVTNMLMGSGSQHAPRPHHGMPTIPSADMLPRMGMRIPSIPQSLSHNSHLNAMHGPHPPHHHGPPMGGPQSDPRVLFGASIPGSYGGIQQPLGSHLMMNNIYGSPSVTGQMFPGSNYFELSSESHHEVRDHHPIASYHVKGPRGGQNKRNNKQKRSDPRPPEYGYGNGTYQG